MKLKTVSTENAGNRPYSQGITMEGVVYLWPLPIDPQSGAIVSPDVAKQTEQCLENAKAIALQAGASLTDVIKTTVFVSDLSQFDTINKVYGQYFASHKPARACIEVARLPKDAKVEIEMIVALA